MTLQEFIKSQIESVDELRALLLLQSGRTAAWNALEVARRLYLQPPAAASILEKLVAKGLLIVADDPACFRYQPQSAELAGMVEQLAEMDRSQPVTLINLVYDRPGDIQAFADAFKVKREKKD